MSQDDLVRRWYFGADSLHFAVLLPPPDGGNPLGEYELVGSHPAAGDSENPWRQAEVNGHPGLKVSIFRRRAIVTVDLPTFSSRSFDEPIRWAIDPSTRTRIVAILLDGLSPQPDLSRPRIIPVLVGSLTERSRDLVGWVGEGITSFHFRMYDATIGKQAVVRASRHIIVVAGTGGRILQEVFNLVYEKMLYPLDQHIEADQVFSFLDGLARYTIPTENSIFLQREFGRLALFLATVQVLVGIWAVVANTAVGWFLLLSIVALLVSVSLIYTVLRKLRLVDWG